jgi:ribosomal-protein-alanine N-acetyltransferase
MRMTFPGMESSEPAAPAWPGSIRPLAAPDLAAVAALEALCNTQPWSLDALKPYTAGEGKVSLVAVLDKTVLGYVLATNVAGESEILILGVHPDARRTGVARALLTDLCARLQEARVTSVFLEVRRGNHAAIALYEAFGFGEAGVRKGYYADTGEDALLLHVFLKKGSR